jgi:membrane dipeptidase
MRASLAMALFLTAPALLGAADDPALVRARAILAAAPVVDGHNDVPWAIRTAKTKPMDVDAYDLRRTTPGQTDLARLRQGHVGGQFWSVYIPGEGKTGGYARVQLEQIELTRRMIDKYPQDLVLALTADDVTRAFGEKRIASLIGIEGGHAIENSLGALRAYYDLGTRYMTLTHNVTLDWADAAGDAPRHGGLTRFGEEVVREMNRLGMLVDLSHVTPETMDDALRVAEAPVIFSHSSARALADVPRNVPDDVLARVKANGGVVMVTFVAAFVSPEIARASLPAYAEFKRRSAGVTDLAEVERIMREEFAKVKAPKATLAQVADHLEHVRKVAGPDHVGLGGDYDGNDNWPVGLEDVSKYPDLFAELVRRGWSDEDLKKLASGNILRVMREAEAAARRLAAARPPSTATIEQLDGPAAAK